MYGDTLINIIILIIVFGDLIVNVIELHNIKIKKKTIYRQLILNVSQQYRIKAREEYLIIKDIENKDILELDWNCDDIRVNIAKLNWYLLISEFHLGIFKIIDKIYIKLNGDDLNDTYKHNRLYSKRNRQNS